MFATIRFFVVFFLAACGSDKILDPFDESPSIEIFSPGPGESLHESDTVTIDALVADEETRESDLGSLTYSVQWVHTDPVTGGVTVGDLGATQTVEGNRLTLEAGRLPAGEHTITVEVIDSAGNNGSDSVTFDVRGNKAPTVAFQTPGDGATVALGVSTRVEVIVADDHTDPTALTLSWLGLPDSVGAPEHPDGFGRAAFTLAFVDPGDVTMDVVVEDDLGAAGVANLTVSAIDPDLDDDGFIAAEVGGGDCDDNNPNIHPDASEYCNGRDDDCDGTTDEGSALDAPTWYPDADGDGFGDMERPENACEAPEGAITDGSDCDDGNATVYPSSTEICDGIDNDCNGVVDEHGALGETTYYWDGDGDGFGADHITQDFCSPDPGWIATSGDCNDANSAAYPGAEERCNDIDDDCDGTIDGPTAVDVVIWYTDADGDAYGDADSSQLACDRPTGTVENDGDCRDDRNDIHPAAAEICDGIDNDCDTTIDIGAVDAPTWFADADADGFGDDSTTLEACEAPSGFVDDDEDCDDGDAGVNPAADEVCDGADNDCDGTTDEDDAIDARIWYVDADSDAYGNPDRSEWACSAPTGHVADGADCDDSDPTIHPAAAEICDDMDNDCDGTVDVDAIDASTWYADSDGDAYGDFTRTEIACEAPSGHVADATDCDDSVRTINPGAVEVCNEVDDDCDGTTDESDSADAPTWYADADADTYGNVYVTEIACSAPSGFVADSSDCDDTATAVNPAADEICNEIDDDCDGAVDEGDALGEATWYRDADADTYGDAAITLVQCAAPSGYVSNDTDCDDRSADIHPAGTEICDDQDNDCDGTVDVDAADAPTWYVDTDADGYGNAATSLTECDRPSGYVADATDCNDTTPVAHPGASEVCDSIDNDCDGTTDEPDAVDALTWYTDGDGDGYGLASDAWLACVQPSGTIATSGDCDDIRADIYPAADEICDSVDNDCDGITDEDDAIDARSWYRDADSDSYGNFDRSQRACDAPSGYIADGADCDDTVASVNPAAAEICDDMDNDCDGTVDVDAIDASTWYADSDGDAYGDITRTEIACEAPSGHVVDATDCDDSVRTINPGAVEVCNEVDDDCDGTTDEPDAADAPTWYADADADTYGNVYITEIACSAPSGFVADSSDCDDTATAVNPAADEICNEIDDDCDGAVDEGDALGEATWYRDADADTYGDAAITLVQCAAPSGYVSNDTDCDDRSADIHPAATEICDDQDNDCDGTIDVDAADAPTWYADADTDGYGDVSASRAVCDRPTGYVVDATDCDDTTPVAHPGATEVCDSIDNDCDGSIDGPDSADISTWYADADTDGYGNPYVTATACTVPSGYVGNDADCDDGTDAVSPAVAEICNEIDDDCDGDIDEGGAIGVATWYADADGDSYGDRSVTRIQCAAPSDFVSNDDDCDDTTAAVNPDIDEVCNAIDDDCDGSIDEDVQSTFYADSDGDGWGDESVRDNACEAPSGFVADAGDCDDVRDDVSPDATEVCDEVDNDCDGSIDEDVQSAFYADSDGDAWGDEGIRQKACSAPDGYTARIGDCDDTNHDIHPDAVEVCDALDNDCDGSIDEGVKTAYWLDRDGDGWGDDLERTTACATPSGYAGQTGDCDDTAADIYPGAPEACDEADNDCDGHIDEGVELTFYVDTDGDGYGTNADTLEACEAPSGYVDNDDDCDETDDAVNPGATEVCNTIDDDCDGATDEGFDTTFYADSDGDSYGDPDEVFTGCEAPSGYITDNTDCDDANPSAYPGARWYYDYDEDGYGRTSPSTTSCTQPDGYADNDDDCADYDASRNPGATDTWYDGVDSDCDGADDYDQDGDGYQWDGYASGTDCDDEDPDRYPGTHEEPWTVEQDGSGDFTTIQEAVDASCTEESLNVGAGTYTENVDLGKKALTLVAIDGPEATVIDGDYRDSVVKMTAGRIEGFTLTHGEATYGGGIYAKDAGDIELVDLVIEHSSNVTYGGGIYFSTSTGSFWMSGSEVRGNQARYGGGLYFSGGGTGAIEITDSRISGNRALWQGAGVYHATNQTLEMSNTDVSDGYATDDGGGLYVAERDGDLDLSSMRFVGNYAKDDGAAIYMAQSADVTLSDVRFSSNAADDNYVVLLQDDIVMVDVEFIGNQSDYLAYVRGLTAAGLRIRDNRAGYFNISGFAVEDVSITNNWGTYVLFGGSGTIDNLLAAGNRGVSQAVYLSGSEIELTNSTIVGNDGDGLKLNATERRLMYVTNTIVAHNGDDGIYVTGSYEPELYYNNVWGNQDDAYVGVEVPLEDGNLQVDPGFVSFSATARPDLWDLHLDVDSMLIDLGDPDIEDDDGTRSDMGAFGGPGGDATYSEDVDADGMPDGWERRFGLDPSSDDAFSDLDGDGLDNIDELSATTDPRHSDTDRDTVGDADELDLGTDPGEHDLVASLAWRQPSYLRYASRIGQGIAVPGDVDGDGLADVLALGTSYGAWLITDPNIDSFAEATSSFTLHSSMVSGKGQPDTDGDGLADVVVGARTFDSSTGVVYVFRNPPAGEVAHTDANVVITGTEVGDQLGNAVASVGDLTEDGADELLVGAYQEDTFASGAGAVYLFSLADAEELDATDAIATWIGHGVNQYAGYSVSSAGDIDGDGIEDMLVGAIGDDTGGTDAGAVYVVSGEVRGVHSLSEATAKIVGLVPYGKLGWDVAPAGDQDDDGQADVWVSAPNAYGDIGVVYLMSGATLLGEVSVDQAIATIIGAPTGGMAGYSIAGNTDLNDDGYMDLVIGAPYDYDGAVQTGAAYVVHGTESGINGTIDLHRADVLMVGESSVDAFGYAVATGDIDADGIDDVLIGAPDYSYGAAYVYYGGW